MITPKRRKRDLFLPLVQLTADAIFIYLLLHAAFWVRFESGWFYDLPFLSHVLHKSDHGVYFKSFWLYLALLVYFLRHYGAYKPQTVGSETATILKAVFWTTFALMAITFFVRGFSFSRSFLVVASVVLATGLWVGRAVLMLLVVFADELRGSHRNILLLGVDEQSKKIVHFYRKNPRFGTRVKGFLDDALPVGTSAEGVPVLGRIDDLSSFLKREDMIHEAVLGSSPNLPQETVIRLMEECQKEMVLFRRVADVFGLISAKMKVSYVAGLPLLSFTDSPLAEWENRMLKRAMDIVFSLAGLLALSPVFAVIAILVRKDSKGPIFYRQERIGENGKRFMLLKFRTMKLDAESETGPVWAKEDDPRRTRLGSWLRKSNLDELPQLWNVLIGNMSLVGPRPERPVFVSQFKEGIQQYMARHSIRSGMTGWAQVNGLRGNTSIEERTKYDLYYIENWSLSFDIKILFLTLFARKNAY